jgi:hypothetical protein
VFLKQQRLYLAAMAFGIFALAGCGTEMNSTICVADNNGVTSSSGNFTLVPADNDFTIYPGQTKQLAVAIQPTTSAAGTVTITGVGLPQGVTIVPVTAAIGTTALVTVQAASNVVSSCFTGINGVYTAARNITLSGSNASGISMAHTVMDVSLENPSYTPSTITLPVMQINTVDQAPIVSEDDYVDATLTITDSNNPSNNYSGTMGIKGHGNSTWVMPKKPYRLNLDSKAPLLGMTSDSNWILLANYDDKSMLRTSLAFQISQIMGMAWTPSTAFAEVYINGVYWGVYQMSEKVEVSKARLDIGSIDDTDNSGTDLTGGYIGEVDHSDGETFMFTSKVGLPIGIADPDPPTIEQSTYFTTNFAIAEGSLYAANYTDPNLGWRNYWNEDSLVQYFLTEELTGNQDSNDYSSEYFYKPRSDPDFYMGPVWDFDISAGNTNESPIVNPSIPWTRTQAAWYKQLFTDPNFVAAVKTQWTAARPQIATLPSFLDTNAALLEQAAANNNGRWPVLGEEVWPNSEAAGTYDGEVAFLKSWLTQRIAYMDANYLQ